MSEWQKPYLMQRFKRKSEVLSAGVQERLNKFNAAKHDAAPSEKPLSKEELRIFDALVSMDYMGSAEYEFGALGQTLQSIRANADSYCAFVFDLKKSRVPDPWWVMREKMKKDFKPPSKDGKFRFYVIGPKEFRTEIKVFLGNAASGQARTKDGHRIDDAVIPEPNYPDSWRIIGGVEETNHWIWTSDPEVHEVFKGVFHVADEAPRPH